MITLQHAPMTVTAVLYATQLREVVLLVQENISPQLSYPPSAHGWGRDIHYQLPGLPAPVQA